MAFREIFRCAGVDQRHNPPGMVIPLGGSNIVALVDPQRKLKVRSSHHAVDVEELDSTEVVKKTIELNNSLHQPGIDSQFKESMLPGLFHGDARFFKIYGKKKAVGFPGIDVVAWTGKKAEAKLKVVVLTDMKIKIAIRNVMVPNADGVMIYHARSIIDPQLETIIMNGVWTPQTNIAFKLIQSEPLRIDDRQRSFKEELGKAYDIKNVDGLTFHGRVQASKLKDVFKKYKIPEAHLTFFVVDEVLSNGNSVNGVAISSHGISFISGHRSRTTFAHEAGHFLGGHVDKNNTWDGFDHTLERDPATGKPDYKEDIRMLMRDGGAGWKIPFDSVKHFRGFFDRHPEY
jgi:hypothetical protein